MIARTSAERLRDAKAALEAAGGKRLTVNLSPQAVLDIARIGRNGSHTDRQVIEFALRCAVRFRHRWISPSAPSTK